MNKAFPFIQLYSIFNTKQVPLSTQLVVGQSMVVGVLLPPPPPPSPFFMTTFAFVPDTGLYWLSEDSGVTWILSGDPPSGTAATGGIPDVEEEPEWIPGFFDSVSFEGSPTSTPQYLYRTYFNSEPLVRQVRIFQTRDGRSWDLIIDDTDLHDERWSYTVSAATSKGAFVPDEVTILLMSFSGYVVHQGISDRDPITFISHDSGATYPFHQPSFFNLAAISGGAPNTLVWGGSVSTPRFILSLRRPQNASIKSLWYSKPGVDPLDIDWDQPNLSGDLSTFTPTEQLNNVAASPSSAIVVGYSNSRLISNGDGEPPNYAPMIIRTTTGGTAYSLAYVAADTIIDPFNLRLCDRLLCCTWATTLVGERYVVIGAHHIAFEDYYDPTMITFMYELYAITSIDDGLTWSSKQVLLSTGFTVSEGSIQARAYLFWEFLNNVQIISFGWDGLQFLLYVSTQGNIGLDSGTGILSFLSLDGENWDDSLFDNTPGDDGHVVSVHSPGKRFSSGNAYTNGEIPTSSTPQWVAVGGTEASGPMIVTSVDGFYWTERVATGTLPDGVNYLRTVAVGADGSPWVAGGNGGAIVRSQNGYDWSWTTIDAQIGINNTITAIRYDTNAGKFIAAMYNTSLRAQLATTIDGLNWTIQNNTIFSTGVNSSLFTTNIHMDIDQSTGRSVVGVDGGNSTSQSFNMARSDDGGFSWTLQSNPFGSGFAIVDIQHNQDGYWLLHGFDVGTIFVPSVRKFATSTNGVNWTVLTFNLITNYGYGPIDGTATWLGVDGTDYYLGTPDGSTWTPYNAIDPVFDFAPFVLKYSTNTSSWFAGSDPSIDTTDFKTQRGVFVGLEQASITIWVPLAENHLPFPARGTIEEAAIAPIVGG